MAITFHHQLGSDRHRVHLVPSGADILSRILDGHPLQTQRVLIGYGVPNMTRCPLLNILNNLQIQNIILTLTYFESTVLIRVDF